MARFRRKRSGGGGSGGGKTSWVGVMGTIFGAVIMLVALISFGIAIGQLDTAYTAAVGYDSQVGLTDVMGIWGMVLFVLFIGVGLASVGGSAYYGAKLAAGGGWMMKAMAVVQALVAVIIALVLNGLIQAQLVAAQVTVNATTNVASFSGLVSIMTIWGMVIFLTLIGAALAPLAGAAYGVYKTVKGRG